MSKKRDRDYEREMKEAANRMRKYPEHLKAAYDSKEWRQFLLDIGVEPEAINANVSFWDSVRGEVSGGFTKRGLAEQGVEVITGKIYRNEKGQFTKEVTSRPVAYYRGYETKKFISPKKLEKR